MCNLITPCPFAITKDKEIFYCIMLYNIIPNTVYTLLIQ